MKINNIPDEQLESQLKYLKLLSKQYPSISSASAEIINLEAVLSLPKGTEHFLSDLHGEYEPFVHVLKNGSGVIKRKIEELFGNIVSEAERKKLATIVYYPEQKLDLLIKEEEDLEDFYRITIHRLIELCRYASSKYTRSRGFSKLEIYFVCESKSDAMKLEYKIKQKSRYQKLNIIENPEDFIQKLKQEEDFIVLEFDKKAD
ncbi:MAG: fructose-bisphosphatase class III [Intestinibacter bartlettii]|nr:fructose-bisphosphatase class III [Intestinibacter bartlettii]